LATGDPTNTGEGYVRAYGSGCPADWDRMSERAWRVYLVGGMAAVALLHLARRCRWRAAKWSRFSFRQLPEVLKAINPGIGDGVQGRWWRTPV